MAKDTAPEFGDPLVQLARVDGSTFIEILEVKAHDDGRLFYCTAVRGLQMVDARDPKAPRHLGELAGSLHHPKFARCQHLDLDRGIQSTQSTRSNHNNAGQNNDRNLLYITHRGDMIQRTPFVTAFDLSHDPPREVATFTKADHTFEGIAARDGKAYVAMHHRGMLVLEWISGELTERAILGDLRGAWGIDVNGSHAYVAETDGSLAVIDIADSGRLTLVSRLDLDGSGQAVTVRDNTAYVSMGIGGVAIVDVANPEKPTLLTTIDTDSAALQIALAGQHAFVANWNDARVYDISSPDNPRLVAIERIATEGPFSRVLGIGARGNTAFIGEWTGMHTYELHPQRRAPDLQLGDLTIDLGPVAAGTSKSELLSIDNPGNAPLRISKLDVIGSVGQKNRFRVKPDALEIAPGGTGAIEVTYQAPDAGAVRPASATLTLQSNDPDAASASVPLRVNSERVGLGSQAPEVEVAIFGGGDWKLSEQRGKVVLLAYFATF